MRTTETHFQKKIKGKQNNVMVLVKETLTTNPRVKRRNPRLDMAKKEDKKLMTKRKIQEPVEFL
jgi:hypothetical protein